MQAQLAGRPSINALHACFVFKLLYFAADTDPLEGFLRALSVAANQSMPSSKSLLHLPQPITSGYGCDITVPEIQVRYSSSAERFDLN